jgi:hypothetical protein
MKKKPKTTKTKTAEQSTINDGGDSSIGPAGAWVFG